MSARTPVQPDVATRWEAVPTVVHLTKQILKLQSITATRVVEAVIVIGDAVAEIRDELPHGEWLRWCAEAVPFSRQTMSNYMGLARWAEERPREVEKLAHLGPSKLYLLLPLPPSVRRRLTGRTPVAIPGGGRKQIETMTVSELARVTALEAKALEGRPQMPVGRLVGRMRRSIERLDASAEALLERTEEVDVDDARALHDALLEVAQSLRVSFSLGSKRR